MVKYHGIPITPSSAAIAVLSGRHAFGSFEYPDQVPLAFEICQSVAIDSGAFTVWKRGGSVDAEEYLRFRNEWHRHPGYDFAVILDVIDGTEKDNDDLLEWWVDKAGESDVPVWHLHESLERLRRLAFRFRRIALGSSGKYSEPGSDEWWRRIYEAMAVVCVDGRPVTKLHLLRGLDPAIFTRLPLSSADSTNVARNIGLDVRWTGSYQPVNKADRAIILANRIESRNSAPLWIEPDVQESLFEDWA